MPKTLYIHNDLREVTEKHILSHGPEKEQGGFFLGKGNELIIPKFIPNVSKEPHQEYRMPKNYAIFLELEQDLHNLYTFIHFHTHPNHTIVSEGDLKCARQSNYSHIYVLLSFDASKKSFTWRAYDLNGEEQYINFISKEYDEFKKYYTEKLGLLHLGDCIVTENGEILMSDPLGKAIMSIDLDTLSVYKYLLNLKEQDRYFSMPTKKKIQDDLQLSATRVNNALDKIRKHKLLGLYNKRSSLKY
jgi:proteasome lid subunit RPN8/RPN11